MNSVKPKNKLLTKFSVANLVKQIVDKLKEEVKTINFDEIRKDPNIVLYLMELVDACLQDTKLIDPKTAKKLDKNQLVLEIIKLIFPSVTEDELKEIQQKIDFIVDSKLITKPTFFCQVGKSLSSAVTYVTGSKKS